MDPISGGVLGGVLGAVIIIGGAIARYMVNRRVKSTCCGATAAIEVDTVSGTVAPSPLQTALTVREAPPMADPTVPPAPPAAANPATTFSAATASPLPPSPPPTPTSATAAKHDAHRGPAPGNPGGARRGKK